MKNISIASKPCVFSGLNKITEFIMGGNHTFAVTEKPEIYCWGQNGYGQLGLGHTNTITIPARHVGFNTNRIKIVTGQECSFAISPRGDLFAWGRNDYGQLGLGHKVDVLKPEKVIFDTRRKVLNVAIGKFHTVAITIAY